MKDQAKLIEAVATLSSVSAVPGKNDKVKWLKKGDSDYLRALLLATYDKYQTYRIQQIEQPDIYAEVQPDTMTEFMGLCNDLAKHILGTNEARARIKKFLATNTKPVAEVFTNVLLRDLRMGCDEKTINKAFPGLVPTFSIQLGYALDSWDRISYPIVVDEKIDGIRCVGIYDGNTTRFYSRKGFEFETGMDVFAENIAALLPGVPAVFDAEFKAFKFNPKNKVCTKHKQGNWQFEYAKSIARQKTIDPKEIKEFFKLYIWDVIDYEYFLSQGVKGLKQPLHERKQRLAALFERHAEVPSNLETVFSFIAESKRDIDRYMQELKEQYKEGCMLKPVNLPYSFSKNYNIIKLKHFVEADMRIVGAYPGEVGKKYADLLGGLELVTDDGKVRTNLGTGFSDMDRADLWVAHLGGKLVGRIVEIQLKDLTETGSVQLPSLIRFREDKDTTDTVESIRGKIHLFKTAGEEE